ncbi:MULTISPECIES: MFS transporter [unclassified Tatumella]|uniref:MFS transporter n=1 Tax=unclassified Tatumella TaxID=2649542 RepID=UPI001BAFCEB3|nr:MULTISPECIES: MFS transporter [unclassified Tatumella]MBS0856236.1 MFS transporter [Tatumella sp. JGM16]MBS0877590.1 MFS transporter [Tatumella sp. JGM82]MBS0891057.1 MFS transporter [Tatumella sp. JGM94]MBS0894500.1 MFS transporter [Tatumella sp. JGM130]MBS0902122.1 MFS transporter [Tatumella sp. JGM100]
MSAIEQTTNDEHLSAPLLFTLAAGAGLSVAAIYYSQPMLGLMGKQFNATTAQSGLIPMLTQAGYALGILLLTPLGDRFDRRKLIAVKGLLLVAALILCAVAPGLNLLLVASLLTGLAATMAQDIVPASAALAPERSRGKTVGTVMTGLLTGILLSRVVSGIIGEYLGWRSLYFIAAASVLLITLALWRVLPVFRPSAAVPWTSLMRSLWKLWHQHATLRRAAIAQGLLSVAFSAFWSTLALMLYQDFGLDSAVAGAFGLAGAAGALAAPLAGGMADRIGPARVTQLGAGLVIFAFGLMLLMPLFPAEGKLGIIVVSAIIFDLGIQASLVAHQTLVFRLAPEARSRLNALLFTVVFIGMAAGSALGSLALTHGGWNGVVILSVIAAVLALVVRLCSRHLHN